MLSYTGWSISRWDDLKRKIVGCGTSRSKMSIKARLTLSRFCPQTKLYSCYIYTKLQARVHTLVLCHRERPPGQIDCRTSCTCSSTISNP